MVEAVVKSLSDGKYAASYVTSQAGEYTLVITVQGQDILGSPFHVLSCSDEVTCVADGAGLTQAIVGETSHFSATLKFVSEFSEGRLPTKDVCILICEEKTKNPVEFETAIYETMNQTRFAVSYEPQLCTNLLITIQFRGEGIEGSPWLVHTHPGHPDPLKCTVYGAGLEEAIVMERASFTLQTADKFGEPLLTGGAKVFAVLATDRGQPYYPSIRDNGDGTYTGTYVAEAAGLGELQLKLGTKPIARSPFQVRLVGPDPRTSCAEGPGLHGAKAGEIAAFYVFILTSERRAAR